MYSSANGHMIWLHHHTLVSNAAMNTGVQISFKILLWTLLALYPEVRFLDHMVILSSVFWEKFTLFSVIGAPFTFLPTLHSKFSHSAV